MVKNGRHNPAIGIQNCKYDSMKSDPWQSLLLSERHDYPDCVDDVSEWQLGGESEAMVDDGLPLRQLDHI